jgi:hypothetical protein
MGTGRFASTCPRLGAGDYDFGFSSASTSFISSSMAMRRLVAAAFEGGFEPGVDDGARGFLIDHALADGDAVGVVVQPPQARRLDVPAQGAAHAAHAVGRDGLAVAAAAQHDAALDLRRRPQHARWA